MIAIEKAMGTDMQLDPEALAAAKEWSGHGTTEQIIRAYLEAAPPPSSAPGVMTFDQWWNASKYRQVIYTGASEKQIARDGWDAALASLSQPAKGKREGDE